MNENKLVINAYKSHLVVLNKKAQINEAAKVVLKAGNHTIEKSEYEKLLPATIDGTGGWKLMIRDGENSVIKQVTTRLNGLKKIAQNSDFMTRLTVANGIVQSKLQYLMPLWLGAPDYLLNCLQVQQLKAARVVCGYKSYYWSTAKLLNTCGWLSIKQQMVATTAIMTHKIIKTGVPRNIYATLITDFPYQTRQAANGDIRVGGNENHRNSKSFKNNARIIYNQIPANIRLKEITVFKKKIKEWAKNNVTIK